MSLPGQIELLPIATISASFPIRFHELVQSKTLNNEAAILESDIFDSLSNAPIAEASKSHTHQGALACIAPDELDMDELV